MIITIDLLTLIGLVVLGISIVCWLGIWLICKIGMYGEKRMLSKLEDEDDES